MRIAITSPNAASWSETFIKAHMDHLAGVELILVDGDLPQRTFAGEPLVSHSLVERVKAKVARTSPFKSMLARAIARKLNSERIDAVLAEYGLSGHAMIQPCEIAGVPLVVHFHGYDAFRDDALEKVNNYKELFSKAAGLVVVSREMEQQLIALGAPPEKVHYNCYGVEVFPYSDDHVPVAQRPPGFMGIGRFVDKKMPVLTILAFMEALKTCPDMKLTLVGEGLLLGACKSLVKAYGLEDNVFLPGKMPHTEVLQLLHSCRGFVQHSIISMNNDHEGTPLAVLEGMAAGLPIIATAHAGIQDQVAHEVSGLLSDEHDIDAMAANLVRIAQDADLAQRMGDAGRAHIVSNLRMDQSIDRLNQIILRCASRS